MIHWAQSIAPEPAQARWSHLVEPCLPVDAAKADTCYAFAGNGWLNQLVARARLAARTTTPSSSSQQT